MTITETDAVSSEFVSGDYAKSKAEATSLVFAAAKNGMNASIVFPSGIIGPGDIAGGSMTTMFRSFLAGRLPLAVRGGYDFVDVRDVARGIADCAENRQRGCGYILSGHYTTIRDMLEALKSAAGVRRTVTYLPLRLARSAAKVCEKFTRRGKKPFFTPYSIAVPRLERGFQPQRSQPDVWLCAASAALRRCATRRTGCAGQSLSRQQHETISPILRRRKRIKRFRRFRFPRAAPHPGRALQTAGQYPGCRTQCRVPRGRRRARCARRRGPSARSARR